MQDELLNHQQKNINLTRKYKWEGNKNNIIEKNTWIEIVQNSIRKFKTKKKSEIATKTVKRKQKQTIWCLVIKPYGKLNAPYS